MSFGYIGKGDIGKTITADKRDNNKTTSFVFVLLAQFSKGLLIKPGLQGEMFRDCCSGIFAGLITDSAEALKTDIHNLRLNTSMNKSTQRAQTSTSAKI